MEKNSDGTSKWRLHHMNKFLNDLIDKYDLNVDEITAPEPQIVRGKIVNTDFVMGYTWRLGKVNVHYDGMARMINIYGDDFPTRGKETYEEACSEIEKLVKETRD